jgi:N4-gp56 family major capsid protein
MGAGTAHDWTFDQDVGVYKNNVISNQLLTTSAAKLKVVPFTRPISGFGKQKGEIMNIMHIKELPDPTSAQLEEGGRIPIDKLKMGNRAIKVVEFGRGVEYTNLSEQLGKFNPRSYLQSALDRQMQRVMDTNAAYAFQDGTAVKICFIPTSLTGGVFDTDGTPSTLASHNLSFDHMGVLADYMSGTIHVPPYEGEDYIGLSCRKSLRGLKQDNLWQLLHMYLQKGDLFFKGEVGKAENIRWVQVDREQAFSNSAGNSTVLGEAVVFGDEGVVRVEVDTPQLYADPNYQSDFGRTKAVAWRGILAFASLWDTATDGEVKIIRITSS